VTLRENSGTAPATVITSRWRKQPLGPGLGRRISESHSTRVSPDTGPNTNTNPDCGGQQGHDRSHLPGVIIGHVSLHVRSIIELRVSNSGRLTVKKPLILATGLLFALPGSASDFEDAPVIYISASRIPEYSVDTAASIRVIERQDIESSGAASITDVLRGQHGIHVYDLYGDGTRSTIDMRGFGTRAGSNVLVLLDGRRLNPSTDAANLYLNDIPLNQVERIEVVHGSSGVLFGNQAVGGVVNIITRRPKSAGSGQISVGLGSHQHHVEQLSLNRRLDSGLGLRIEARKLATDGYRENNESDVLNLNLLVDYQAGDSRVFFEQRHLDESVENPGALFLDELAADRRQSFTNYRNDFTDTASDVSRLGVEHRLDRHWRLFADASYRHDDVAFRLSSRYGQRTKIDSQDREIITLTPRVHAELPVEKGNLRLTLGSDIERSDYDIDGITRQTAEQHIAAIYGQAVYPLNGTVDVALGVRHAWVDNDILDNIAPTFGSTTSLDLDDEVTVGSLGLTYRPDNRWRWFARADQNYRFAKIEEHTLDSSAVSFPFLPSGVKNQRGLSLEGGIEYTSPQRSVALQIYRLTLKDELSFNATSGANINIDSTERQGLNFSIKEYLPRNIELGLDIDLTEGKITSGPHQGSTIPMVPRHQTRLSTQWRPSSDWSIGGNLLHVSKQVLDSDYQNAYKKLDDYTVVNVNAQYRRGNWTIDARLNNLFNRQYSEFGTVGDAAAAGTVHGECQTGSFGTDNCPAFTPSPERTLWIGAKYTFGD